MGVHGLPHFPSRADLDNRSHGDQYHAFRSRPPPPVAPNHQPSSSFPLLSLPRDVLVIVVAEAEDKALWRLVCTQLRDMVDAAVTSLGHRRCVQRDLVFTSQLIMQLPRLTKVDISNARGIRDLTPLAACVALQHLDCNGTAISSLAPLAVCTALHTLDCSHTAVSSLAPLAACVTLQNLNCSNTFVNSLAPLATCTLLHTLNCSLCRRISSLDSLVGCKSLHTLRCHYTAVSSLAPLASCSASKELWCNPSLQNEGLTS